MLSHKVHPDRWFVWALVFLFVAGIGMISYLQWVNLNISTEINLMLADKR